MIFNGEAVFNNLIKNEQEFDSLIKQIINQIFSCENALFTC